FINGESYRASGRDATLMRALADQRALGAGPMRRLSAAARELVGDWHAAGWLHLACETLEVQPVPMGQAPHGAHIQARARAGRAPR
ncbi:MAG: hypothetical protein Q8N17_13570, partial [Burkholderiaceae bacterium]|nr:hypothetical protein [Burkholderiaceae bacterium]